MWFVDGWASTGVVCEGVCERRDAGVVCEGCGWKGV